MRPQLRITKITRILKDPCRALFLLLTKLPRIGILDDEQYLRVLYHLTFRKKLNLESPTTFSEKLQWLKLNDRQPSYTQVVDKLAAKQWAAEIIGKEHTVVTLGVWDRFDEINFADLPNQFVLKTTHDSGGVFICRDKSRFDYRLAKNVLNRSLKRDYSRYYREWPYKAVPRRIIAEEYLGGENDDLRDYKFLCFGGAPKLLFVNTGRESGKLRKNFFDMDFQPLEIFQSYPEADEMPSEPKNFTEMKSLAKALSKGFPQIRIDFYEVSGRVIFGEATLFTSAGLSPFEPDSWDHLLGSWIELPQPPSNKQAKKGAS